MTKIPIHANVHRCAQFTAAAAAAIAVVNSTHRRVYAMLINRRYRLRVWARVCVSGCMCCVCMGKWHSKHLQFCLTKQHFYLSHERGSVEACERDCECVCVSTYLNKQMLMTVYVCVIWMNLVMLSKEHRYYHARTRSHTHTCSQAHADTHKMCFFLHRYKIQKTNSLQAFRRIDNAVLILKHSKCA